MMCWCGEAIVGDGRDYLADTRVGFGHVRSKNILGELTFGLLIVLGLVLAAEFVNGATDSPNAIATVVSTRVLSPAWAVVLATVFNAVGVMSGTAVAATIGKGFVQHEAINLATIAAAMVAIVAWSSLAWRFGLPTSESHALVANKVLETR